MWLVSLSSWNHILLLASLAPPPPCFLPLQCGLLPRRYFVAFSSSVRLSVFKVIKGSVLSPEFSIYILS